MRQLRSGNRSFYPNVYFRDASKTYRSKEMAQTLYTSALYSELALLK